MPSLPRAPRLPKVVRELAPYALVGVVVTSSRSSLADYYVVPSGSMTPTVAVGDRILVDKRAFGFRIPLSSTWITHASPHRGDVVVLNAPDEPGTILLKRVVAIAGDRVVVEDGHVRIEGRLEHEPATLNLEDGGGPNFGPVRVPEGQVLVLGDHRGNSRDGRYFGFVRSEDVLGRAERVFVREGKPAWIPLDR